MSSEITLVSSVKCFEGYQRVYSHISKELSCEMKFSIYLPPQCVDTNNEKLPVVYWLSGLTCTQMNFIEKSGAQKYAAELGLIIVCPDTSPRNVDIPGQDDDYDFGSGAGFYINATAEPWNKHYKMFNYVTSELNEIINSNFSVDIGLQSISGHSMGGHGALISSLKCPGKYKSVSAFAPISNPTQCQWGQKAFTGYFGKNTNTWKEWDATELVPTYNGPALEIYIDQGDDDTFLRQNQLLPMNFVAACKNTKINCKYNSRNGYDHSYYFISTFIKDHLVFHKQFLKK